MDFDDLIILLTLLGVGYAVVKTPVTREAVTDYAIKGTKKWTRETILDTYGDEWHAYWGLT
jgi:hypothetical protein